MKIRDYRGLLAVFVAAGLGISLLCSVSGMAIQDLNQSATGVDLQPADILDAAVSNLNTAGALTKQAFAELIPTSTPTFPPTASPTATVAPITPTAFRFPTLSGPTRTRRPGADPSKTAIPPTRTEIPPTDTPVPTNTLEPTATPTDIPPSPTDIPPSPTDIPPSPTDIPPSPTDIPTSGIPITGATETQMP